MNFRQNKIRKFKSYCSGYVSETVAVIRELSVAASRLAFEIERILGSYFMRDDSARKSHADFRHFPPLGPAVRESQATNLFFGEEHLPSLLYIRPAIRKRCLSVFYLQRTAAQKMPLRYRISNDNKIAIFTPLLSSRRYRSYYC